MNFKWNELNFEWYMNESDVSCVVYTYPSLVVDDVIELWRGLLPSSGNWLELRDLYICESIWLPIEMSSLNPEYFSRLDPRFVLKKIKIYLVKNQKNKIRNKNFIQTMVFLYHVSFNTLTAEKYYTQKLSGTALTYHAYDHVYLCLVLSETYSMRLSFWTPKKLARYDKEINLTINSFKEIQLLFIKRHTTNLISLTVNNIPGNMVKVFNHLEVTLEPT